MRHRAALVLSVALIAVLFPGLAAAQKARVLVLTDIENEPDDAMSMVRLLTYANQWALRMYTPRMQKWLYEPETRPFWADAEDEVLGVDGNWHTSNKATIWRWRAAYQNDFAARMDWTMKPFAEANHPPVARLRHSNQLTVTSGDLIDLSAEGSSDPDGQALAYEWFYYGEPGTLILSSGRTGAPLKIEDANSIHAWCTAPKVSKPETMHIILAVTD